MKALYESSMEAKGFHKNNARRMHQAIMDLHRKVCNMDSAQLELFQKIMGERRLVDVLNGWARVEEMRQI